ncbi:MAG: lysophospholipid acyltransferase family protein [Gammaproteobacteria bacterium]
MKYFCSLSFKLSGPDLNSSQLIISRHQSAWETIFLAAFVQKPIFILKKELLMIPIFGWCLYLLKNISINRADGRTSLRKIIKSCGEHVNKNRTLIIFPEGTRIAYGEQSSLKKGIFKILDVLKMQSILINHDAGKYWSKNSLIIKPGIISIETISLKYSSDMDEIKQRIINHFA